MFVDYLRSGLCGVGFKTARLVIESVLKATPSAAIEYATAIIRCARKLFQNRKKSFLSVNRVTVTKATQPGAAAALVRVYQAFAIQ